MGAYSIIAPHNPKKMLSPSFQRISHFGLVSSPIVHPGYTGAMATHVVQHCFHDMRQNAQPVRHHGRSRAAKIVHGPMR